MSFRDRFEKKRNEYAPAKQSSPSVETEKKPAAAGGGASVKRHTMSTNPTSFRERFTEKRDQYSRAGQVDGAFINSYVRDYNNFQDTARKDYERMGYGNAAIVYGDRQKTADDLKARRTAIDQFLLRNRGALDAESLKTLEELAKSSLKGTNDTMKAFKEALDWYSYDFDEGTRETARLESALREYQSLSRWETDERGRSRLEELRSQYGDEETIQNLIDQKRRTHQEHEDDRERLSMVRVGLDGSEYFDPNFASLSGVDSSVGDARYQYVNDPKFRTEYQNRLIQDQIYRDMMTGTNSGNIIPRNDLYEAGLDMLTPEETAIYNYHYRTGGKEQAERYLSLMADTLIGRKAKQEFAGLDGDTLEEVVFGASVGVDSFEQGMKGWFGGETPSSVRQVMGSMAREDLADVGGKLPGWMGGASLGQMAYDTVNTTANMAPSILVGTIGSMLGQGWVGGAMLGASAGGNARQEALRAGYTEGQATAYGAMVGAAEMAMEKLLGGISSLGGGGGAAKLADKLAGGRFTGFLNKLDSSFWKIAGEIGEKMYSEGAEEYLQEILDPILRNAALGEDNKLELVTPEALYSGLLGAITGGLMEAPGVFRRNAQQSRQMRETEAAEVVGAENTMTAPAVDGGSPAATPVAPAGDDLSGDSDENPDGGAISGAESTKRGRTIEEAAREFGEQAGAVTKYYEDGQDVEIYAREFRAAYDMGRSGVQESYAVRSEATQNLTEHQRKMAWMTGRGAAKLEAQRANAALPSGTAGARRRGIVRGVGVNTGDIAKSLNIPQSAAYKTMSFYAEATGVDVVLYRSSFDPETGEVVSPVIDGVDLRGANGAFSWKNDKLYIDLNAGVNHADQLKETGRYIALRTFGHEFTHFVEKWNPEGYGQLRETAFSAMARAGMDVDGLIARQMSLDSSLDYDRASREVVAEAMSDILRDASFAQELAQKDRTVFDKIRSELKKLVQRIREYWKNLNPNRDPGAKVLQREVDGTLRYLDEIVELYDRVATEAALRYQEATGTVRESAETAASAAVLTADDPDTPAAQAPAEVAEVLDEAEAEVAEAEVALDEVSAALDEAPAGEPVAARTVAAVTDARKKAEEVAERVKHLLDQGVARSKQAVAKLKNLLARANTLLHRAKETLLRWKLWIYNPNPHSDAAEATEGPGQNDRLRQDIKGAEKRIGILRNEIGQSIAEEDALIASLDDAIQRNEAIRKRLDAAARASASTSTGTSGISAEKPSEPARVNEAKKTRNWSREAMDISDRSPPTITRRATESEHRRYISQLEANIEAWRRLRAEAEAGGAPAHSIKLIRAFENSDVTALDREKKTVQTMVEAERRWKQNLSKSAGALDRSREVFAADKKAAGYLDALRGALEAVHKSANAGNNEWNAIHDGARALEPGGDVRTVHAEDADLSIGAMAYDSAIALDIISRLEADIKLAVSYMENTEKEDGAGAVKRAIVRMVTHGFPGHAAAAWAAYQGDINTAKAIIEKCRQAEKARSVEESPTIAALDKAMTALAHMEAVVRCDALSWHNAVTYAAADYCFKTDDAQKRFASSHIQEAKESMRGWEKSELEGGKRTRSRDPVVIHERMIRAAKESLRITEKAAPFHEMLGWSGASDTEWAEEVLRGDWDWVAQIGRQAPESGPSPASDVLKPGEEGVAVNAKGEPVAAATADGTVQFSLRTYEEDGRAAMRAYLQKAVINKRLTKAEMDEMIAGIEEIYAICKKFKDKYAPFSSWSDAAVIRDTRGRPVFSVVTPNGDYKMNLDFSLVCKKRRTLDAVFNEMTKRGIIDDFELGQKSVVRINEIIRSHGLETACALCFVDAKRFRQADVADTFVKLYNDLVRSMVPDGTALEYHNFGGYEGFSTLEDAPHTWSRERLDFSHLDEVMRTYGRKTVEHKTARYLKTHPEGRKLLMRGDFMSSGGFDAVKTGNRSILSLYNSKKGTGGPKAAFGDVQYMNEILSRNAWTPEKAYEVGGVRIQSFSDYVPRMIFDYAQMIYDLAAKKLPAHAYTKEALFAKQFGLAGVKINMSLIPAIADGGIAPGLDAKGNYVWAGESFDFETAKAIQNAEGYTENCGTICVGVSYDHIVKLLGDPDIRMVIPYHKSGLNPIVAHMNKIAAFTDYTTLKTNPGGCQNTMDKDGNKVTKDFNFNEVLRQTGDPRATAQQYLEWCAGKGYKPRFAEFAWHENYYKLLTDFTVYDKDGNYVPQREVRAAFPKEDAAFGSMKGLIEEGLQEDAVIEGRRDKNLGKIVDEIQAALPRTEAEIDEVEIKQAEGDVEKVQYSHRWDEGYAAAVARGDMQTAQQMVDEAAKAAGYVPVTRWHQTNKDFTKFNTDNPKAGLNDSETPNGIFFKTNNHDIGLDGKKQMPLYLKLQNPLRFADRKEANVWYRENVPGYGKLHQEYDDAIRPLSERMDELNDKIFDTEDDEEIAALEAEEDAVLKEMKSVEDDFRGRLRRLLDDYFLTGKSGHDGIELEYDGHRWVNGKREDVHTFIAFKPNQAKSAKAVTYDDSGSVIPLSERFNDRNLDIRYSKRTEAPKYSYEWFLRKPNMDVTVVDDTDAGNWSRNDILDKAVENAKAAGTVNKNGNAVVHVNDNGADVIVSRGGLKHGMDRRTGMIGAAVANVGDILKNAVQVNELYPREGTIKDSYVLIGAAKNKKNEPYIVSFVVNRHSHKLVEMDVLYSVNAKTEPAGSLSPRLTAENADSFTGSTVSIEHLLEFVNIYYPDILPEGVLKHFGHESRPYGVIGKDALYQRRESTLSDWEVLERASEALGSAKLSKAEQEALGDFQGRLAKLEGLEAQRAEQGAIWRDNQFAEGGDREKARLARNRMKLLDEKIRTGYAELLSLEDKQTLRGVLKKARGVVEQQERQEVDRQAREFRREQAKQHRSDIRTMEREFLRLVREYEKTGAKAASIQEALDSEVAAHKADQENWNREFKRLMKEYEAADRKADKLAERLERQKELGHKRVESRKKTALRHRIEGTVKELERLLLKGDKKRHVKEGMRNFVEEALASATVLFADTYSDEALVLDGIGTELTPEENRLIEETQRLLGQKKDLLSAPAIATESEAIAVGDTSGFDKRMKEIQKLDRQISANMGKLHDVLVRERSRLNRATVGAVLANLSAAYRSLGQSDDLYIRGAALEEVWQHLDGLAETIGGATARDLTLEQLEAVSKAFQMVLHTVRNANKLFAEGQREDLVETSRMAAMEVTSNGKHSKLGLQLVEELKKFGFNNLKPVYFFEHLGSRVMRGLYKGLLNGQSQWAKDVDEARDFYRQAAERAGFDKWDMEKTHSFRAASGEEFKLNLQQMMSLYAYSRREKARDHIRKGGIVIDADTDIQEVVEIGGKLKVKIKGKATDATAYNIDDVTLGEIVGKLTKEQKAFVEEMQTYLSDAMGGKGNEVSMTLYGVKLFNEQNYLPIRSAHQYMVRAKEQAEQTAKIKNAGFTKSTVPHASNPVVLTPFLDIWADHVNEMSLYHSMTLPLEDLHRVYTFSQTGDGGRGSESVTAAIENAFGAQATGYIDQLMKDLNGGARVDSTTGIINKSLALFKKGSTFLSASVVIQQPSAILRATALVDSKYFQWVKIPGKWALDLTARRKQHDRLWAECKQYAPIALIKEMGYFDTSVGRTTRDFIQAKEYNGWSEKARAMIHDSGYRDEVFSKAPALADELAWSSIWEAVKREQHDKHPKLRVSSEEFLKLCGERFTEVIDKTQVYDSVLARSANMRSKDTGMKMATAFMAEPTVSANMVADAMLKGKRGDRKFAWRAIGSVLASGILNAMLYSIVAAARDDDEDKEYWERYLGSVTGEVFEVINPATYLPFARDIVSLLQGYDVERSDMALVSDLVNAIRALSSDSKTTLEKVEGFVGVTGKLFGLPVGNIWRDVKALYNVFENDIDSQGSTAVGIGYAIMESLPFGKAAGNGQQLYEARISGNAEHEQRVAARYKDDTAVQAALRKALRENDGRIREAAVAWNEGRLEEYMILAKQIIAEKHFHQDDVVAAIQAEAKSLLPDQESRETAAKHKGLFTAAAFAVAAADGDKDMMKAIREDLIQTAVSNGKDRAEAEKSVNSGLKDELKDCVLDGLMTEQRAQRALSGYCGMDDGKAAETIAEWKFEADHGHKWSDRMDLFTEAAVDGNREAENIRQEVIAAAVAGGESREEAEKAFQSSFRTALGDLYEAEGVSDKQAVKLLEKYGGESADDALATVRYWEFRRDNPGVHVDESWIDRYYSEIQSSGMSIEVYVDYRERVKGITGSDKKAGRMAVIDSLPITDAQKDALYYAEGWAKSTIWEAPWH